MRCDAPKNSPVRTAQERNFWAGTVRSISLRSPARQLSHRPQLVGNPASPK